jgi:hypothetical protein
MQRMNTRAENRWATLEAVTTLCDYNGEQTLGGPEFTGCCLQLWSFIRNDTKRIGQKAQVSASNRVSCEL